MLLITGGLGFIGSHIAVYYLQQNPQQPVLLIDNLSNSSIDVLQMIKKLHPQSLIHFEKIDLTDLPALKKIFVSYPISHIIHCAGLKAVGESVQKPILYYHQNILSTIHLLQCIQEYPVKTLIFSSSATVYGKPQLLPIPVSHSKSPNSPYGQTKSMIEDILQDCSKVLSCNIIILRYFNPVGSHPSGLLPEIPSVYPNNLFPAIIAVIQGKLPHLNIFESPEPTPDQTGIRDYIYIGDLAKAHLSCLNHTTSFDIFNVGTGTGLSVLEVVNEFEKQLQKEIPKKMSPPRKGDVAICYADVSKWKDTFGWIPDTPLSVAVQTSLFSI